jgi:pimeloyl-ACP methyl ester carboxylesterase
MPTLKFQQFETTDRLLLSALLFEPDSKTKKAAIYLHGNGSSSVFGSVLRTNTMAKELNAKNIAFLAFNNRGAEFVRELDSASGEDFIYGSGFEIIKDCIKDIDGAVNHLESQGYNTFYLIGHSTGANKICVYNYYKPKNKIAKYALLAGGDDTGLYYKQLGPKPFSELLQLSRQQVKIGNGAILSSEALPFGEYMSYQSLNDILDPDGDYNDFPYYEHKNHLKLAKKELFREFKSIKKPSLVLYGSEDECCFGAKEAAEILKKETSNAALFDFQFIEGSDHGFHGHEEQMAKAIAKYFSKRD